MLMLYAALSGVCFSLMGIAYRLGTTRGVSTVHVFGVCGFLCTVVFGVRTLDRVGDVPAMVWGLGLLSGVVQYVTAGLLGTALRLGPLSPIWCVLMLGFIPITVYTYLRLGEVPTAFQVAAIAAGIGCVVASSLTSRPTAKGAVAGASKESGASRTVRTHIFQYAAVLVALLLLNSVANVCMKELGAQSDGAGGNLRDRFPDAFLAGLYGAVTACFLLRQIVTRAAMPSWRWMTTLGGLSALGATVGMALLIRSVSLPAAVVFTLSSMTSILVTAVVSVTLMGERRTPQWYAAMAFGLVAVLLASGQSAMECLRGWF